MYDGKKKNKSHVQASKVTPNVSSAVAGKTSPKLAAKEPRAGRLRDPRRFYDWAATLDDKQDVRRSLSREERVVLLEGPAIELTCADEVVGTIPLRLAVATSKVARKIFIKNEGKGIFRIGVAHPSARQAVKRLNDYLKATMSVYTYPFVIPKSTMPDDIDLLLVTEALGMEMYADNLRRMWWGVLKNESLPKIGLDNIAQLELRINEYTDRSPILNMFIQRWGGIGFYDRDEDKPFVVEWREKLPNLEAAVSRLYMKREAEHAEFRKKRQAEREAEIKQKEEQKRQQFDEELRAARGGRSGGYGMGV